MNKFLVFASLLIVSGINTHAVNSDIKNAWSGSLAVSPSDSLTLIFHFDEKEDGEPAFSIDVPAQNVYGLSGEIDTISGDSVNVSVARIAMNYAGKLANGIITGKFSQGPVSLPLILKPYYKELKRPQTPQPPFPYTSRDVRIKSVDSTMLAATVTLPANYNVSTPAVVLVTGSGQQNRDEEVFGHKPFAVIADYLARNGIASIRYDDRGYGESTGNVKTATTADFAFDAQAVVDYMRKTEKFASVGVLGHSEGAQIAFMLGAGKVPDFIIAVGAPAVRGDSILVSQNSLLLNQAGYPHDVVDKYCDALANLYKAKIKDGKWSAMAVACMTADRWKDAPLLNQMGQNLIAISTMDNNWMDYFIAYSPAADIAATVCPALVVYGAKDIQVVPSVNKPIMERLAPKADIREYESLNHLMQHAVKGTIDEYGQIEETFSPEVLSDITSFILRVNK